MLVTVRMADGTVQSLDAESVTVIVDGSPVDLCLMGTPEKLMIYSVCDEQDSYQFVVYHSAENAMLLQSKRSDTYREPSAG